MSEVSTSLSHLNSLLSQVTTRDRYRLQRAVGELSQTTTPDTDALDTLSQSINASVDKVNTRRAGLPDPQFPESLPISQKREEIAGTIADHQVVIIAGETGSGKTTQLPKICLSLGLGARGMIGHTQPRRLAARSVANRIAEELNTNLGDVVGYQVRFTDQVSENTAIKLMTDGILLAEIQNDRFLSRYDTIIIDEAHERSLNIDFLLGYLKQLLPKRPDLKVIITSATIDVEKFSKHFNDAPIISVSGRTFPVDVLYRPLIDTESDSQFDGILNAIHEINEIDHQGDILVFMAGEGDIRETALRLRRASFKHLEIVPLYARLSIQEQNKVFQAHKGRRVVLATNVAETSLTVPGIRYVIDPGLARISRYSFRTKIQRLPIEPVSQASANQRKGRCGRVSEGVCIRLYDEDDFNQRPEFTEPEILRTNLAAVILQMAQLRLGDIEHFPFVDRPDHRLINDGRTLLQELQAINPKGKLTKLGQRLARLPVDPRLGRMLLAAERFNCLNDALIIISALAVQDPRERPADKQQAADQKHREHWHEQSDFIAYLNLWQRFEKERQELSKNQFAKWCKKNFLSYLRLREWREVHMQLRLSLKTKQDSAEQDLYEPETHVINYSAIHRALLTGLLGNIGCYSKEVNREYIGARNKRWSVFPGSSQFKKSHQWILAAQLLETSKLYAHTVAKVEPEWILQAAEHLVKRHYVEPHYNARAGQVMAFEKITLYGLVLVEKKRVSYGKIHPTVARETFIRAALVEGAYSENRRIQQVLRRANSDTHFWLHLQKLLNELHDLEAKSRRKDIIVDEEILFSFFDELIPLSVMNLEGFEHWRKEAEHKQAKCLFIDRQRLMQHDANQITVAQFPNSLPLGDLHLPVCYHFDPLHEDDGVTLKVPVQVLGHINAARLEWLVPGLLREKCIALIKGLPKSWRKNFVPVPQFVDKVLPHLQADDKPLGPSLGFALKRATTVDVPDELWQSAELEAYYRINIHVLDEAGKCIARGRDIELLRDKYRDHMQSHIQKVGNDFEKTGLLSWDFGQLPKTYDLKQTGMNVRAYPSLVDCGNSVDIKLHDQPEEALVQTQRGLVRLAILAQTQTVKYLHKQLFKNRELGLTAVDLGKRDEVIDDVICAAVKQSCFNEALNEENLPRDEKAFLASVNKGRADIVGRAEAIVDILVATLEQVLAIKKQIKQSKNALTIAYASADIQQQLTGLFYSGFIYETPFEQLQQYPRFLKAITLRLDKVAMQVQKDRLAIADIQPLWEQYQAKVAKEGRAALMLNQSLQHYRWMLEELRVSLFAQTLGTREPVSVKRLKKQWELC